MATDSHQLSLDFDVPAIAVAPQPAKETIPERKRPSTSRVPKGTNRKPRRPSPSYDSTACAVWQLLPSEILLADSLGHLIRGVVR
jgi:hypothetical protein